MSQGEHDQAEQLRREFMNDADWVRKYLDGDVPARRQMTLISIILSSAIKKD